MHALADDDEPREKPITLSALLTFVYPIPRDTVSLEEFERRRHQDLAALPTEQLEREKDRVRLRLTIEPDPHHAAWLAERRQYLLGELERRRAPRVRHEASLGVRSGVTPIPPLRLVARTNGKDQRL